MVRQAGTAAFAFLARSMQQITTFILTLMAARYLSPAEYGVYTLSILFVMFLQTLIYSGFFNYMLRAKGDNREVVDTSFWLILALSIVGSALLYFGAPFLSRVFDAEKMRPVLQILALTQPIVALTAWCSAVLMRDRKLRLHFNIMISQNIIALVAGIAILVALQSVFALVVYRVVRAASGALLYVGLSGVRPGFCFRRDIAWDAVRFSSNLYGTRILGFASNYGADLALGLIFSTAEAGLYRFGSRLAMGAIDIVGQPMRSFALTQFGSAHREDAEFSPIVERFSSATLVLMGLVAGTILIFAEDVVREFFQPEYAGALVVTYAIAARALLGVGNSLVEPVLASSGYTRQVFWHFAVWTTVQIALIPVAAQFGLGVLAWASAAAIFAASLSGLRLLSHYCGVEARRVVEVMAEATVFVIVYTLLAALTRETAQTVIGAGELSLFFALAVCCLLGISVLYFAIRRKTLDLGVFAG